MTSSWDAPSPSVGTNQQAPDSAKDLPYSDADRNDYNEIIREEMEETEVDGEGSAAGSEPAAGTELRQRADGSESSSSSQSCASDLAVVLKAFAQIYDSSIPDEDLATLVEDAEWAVGWVNDKKMKLFTELGLCIIALIELRRRLRSEGSLRIIDFEKAKHTIHLRVREDAKFQIRHADRHGCRLWAASFLEFGTAHWTYLDEIAGQAVSAVMAVLQSARPNTSSKQPSKKPAVILVGHAIHNNERELESTGLDWEEHFDVLQTVDTQIVCWDMAGEEHQAPGLLALLRQLRIRSVHLHNGANDASYTASLLVAVAGNPMADVGSAVDVVRNMQYTKTNTTHLYAHEVCDCCGIVGHNAYACLRRCGYCLQRRFQDNAHSYVTCPLRKDGMGADASKATLMYSARGSDKGFVLSSDERADLAFLLMKEANGGKLPAVSAKNGDVGAGKPLGTLVRLAKATEKETAAAPIVPFALDDYTWPGPNGY